MKILKLKNMADFDAKHNDYGFVLSETSPEIIFKDNYQTPVGSYLWYHFKMEHMPRTFSDYFREKLGITNPGESYRLIKS